MERGPRGAPRAVGTDPIVNIPFLKMHGAANDFVVIDHRRPFLSEPLEARIARWCDRRRGIGADGVLLLETDAELDFAMRYFNSDGRPAEYCGNGARCLARLALDLGLGSGSPRRVRFRTRAGIQTAREAPAGNGIELHFGRVSAPGEAIIVESEGRRFAGRILNAGVPHFVTEVERVEWVPVAEWGASLRHHERFGPDGANVDFVARLNEGRIAMRTYERGVEAETLACGTGAIACALTIASAGKAKPPIRIWTRSGLPLDVTWTEQGRMARSITLKGEGRVVYRGILGSISTIDS
jgi:diaminopimelate epimerase